MTARQQAAGSRVQQAHPRPGFSKDFATHLLPGRRLAEAGVPLLSVVAAAAWLKVSTATIYRLCSAGKLAHCRVSNAIRIPPSAVDAYVEACGGP